MRPRGSALWRPGQSRTEAGSSELLHISPMASPSPDYIAISSHLIFKGHLPLNQSTGQTAPPSLRSFGWLPIAQQVKLWLLGPRDEECNCSFLGSQPLSCIWNEHSGWRAEVLGEFTQHFAASPKALFQWSL